MATYDTGYELSIYNSRSSQAPIPTKSSISDLLSLPLELHYLIISHLDLEGLLQLRRTSGLYYHVINSDLVRKLFVRNGRASLALAACCYECLATPGLDRLVVDKDIDPVLWRSVCFRCWSKRITVDYHINPWPVVQIANGDEGYICHFCNWPVVNNGRDDGIDRLHAACRARRRLVLVLWMAMAVLQFGIGVLCAVLAWTRYKHQQGILIPSSIDFALAMISVVVFICRICTNNEIKYTRLLFAELILTILRIPPVAYSARTTVAYRTGQGLLPRFGFGVFLINLIFRILDFVGHALLNSGYDPRRFLQKGLSRRTKIIYGVATFLVYFAYIPF
ncbi:hypothetical protein SAMD00023353_4800420 [Rosellinia necatrix]|uniref:F-box domain-containing protein n=1 Tax=Rosellinia necatrix TaxID=77044 RepID=A0A1W2TQC4_ROSNE|nr:hypothetical protein SAMD00023353_4800420 [Rosellinia necatrix]